MDLLFEIIFELIFEGTVELGTNKKVPKWIRYPFATILILFFIIIIGGLIVIGINNLKNNLILSLLFIALGLFLLIMGIIKFKKTYIEKSKNNEKIN